MTSLGTQEAPIPESEPSFRCSPSSSTVTPGSVRLPLLAAHMGTTAIDSDEQQYSCKCLNIRFRPTATQAVAAELNADPDFTQLFVGGEGIVVVCSNDVLCILRV
jgi:hypothetical protein